MRHVAAFFIVEIMLVLFMLENLMFLLKRQRIVVFLLAGFLACIGGCSNSRTSATPAAAAPPLHRYEYAQVHMGMQVRLVVYAKDEPSAIDACSAAFDRVSRLDEIASDYRPSSELMQLCAKAGGPPVHVSDDLYKLIERSVEVSKISGGTFDITVGPYVALWRQARKDKQFPKEEDLKKARELVGYEKIKLDEANHTVHLAVPGMKLDLGGIAKGYAGDCAIEVLKEHGIKSALFEAGGDVVVSDSPPGMIGWVLEVVGDEVNGQPRHIAVHNHGISTSGSTEQFVIISGKCYSHIIDPRTGLGVTEPTLVTVVAENGITSDSLSKPACILGPKGFEEVKKHYSGIVTLYRKG